MLDIQASKTEMMEETPTPAPKKPDPKPSEPKPVKKDSPGKSGTGIFEKESTYGRCNHGPKGRCVNCIQKGKEGKHISFDHFLKQNNAHQATSERQGKLTSVDLPYETSYTMKTGCTSHEPYPKGMCNKCMPPSIIAKRQEYRHVDYCQFQNFEEINGFIAHWLQTFENRVGILYGYYAEDPDYELGVRAVIEAVYEPPQQGSYKHFVFLEDPHQGQVDRIASEMGLERVGWVFTTNDTDHYITSEVLQIACKFQREHMVDHPAGYKVSKFLTVVLRGKIQNFYFHFSLIFQSKFFLYFYLIFS